MGGVGRGGGRIEEADAREGRRLGNRRGRVGEVGAARTVYGLFRSIAIVKGKFWSEASRYRFVLFIPLTYFDAH